MKIINTLFFIFCIIFIFFSFEVTANETKLHKRIDHEIKIDSTKHEISTLSQSTVKREDANSPDIIYYFSRPQNENFPIAILCTGSSLEDNITSIIPFHHYFLKTFIDLGVGALTLEQQGVDSSSANIKEFMAHYTRSNRLKDHRIIIEYIKKYPPQGWNGKLIFLGVSEGGPIVTTLTTHYSNMTIATINWSGAGDFSWSDQVWYFMQDIIQNTPWTIKLRARLPSWMPYSLDLYYPRSRKAHDLAMAETIKNPSANLKLAGMTYKYHADALKIYPKTEYEKIKTPYLVVTGMKDSIIDSSNVFVYKAKKAGAPITYMRVENMDHYVKEKENVMKDSFSWLKEQLLNQGIE